MVSNIFVISALDGSARPTIMGIDDKQDVNWWRWVGDQWLAVGLGSQQVIFGSEYYVTRVLAVSIDGKTSRRLGWEDSGLNADDVIWVSRGGAPHLLLARQTGI